MFSFAHFFKDTKSPQVSLHDKLARVAIAEDGRVVYASQAFCDLAHIPPPETENIPVGSILHFANPPETLENLTTGVHKVSLNGNTDLYDFHFDWLTAPDQKRYLIGSEAKKTPATPRSLMGTITKNLFKIVEQNNRAARKTQPAQTLNHNDLVHFSGMASDVMIVTDDLGEILRTNETFSQLFGHSPEELGTMDFIDLFHEADKPYIRNTIQPASLETEGYQDAAIDFEARILTKDGEERWMEWRYHQGGGHIYCIGHDITAIKQQKNALTRREKQLSEAESLGHMGHWHWTIGEDTIEWSSQIYRIFGVTEKDFT